MSEQVTVIEAKNPRPWQHGITYYDMIFDRQGQRFGCSWGKKGDPPQEGEVVTGEFSQDKEGEWKFKKGSSDFNSDTMKEANASQHSSPASSQPRSTSKGSGGGETNWEVRNGEIRRQHSQQVAIEFASLHQATGDLPGDFGPEDLRALIDWFDQDAVKAGQR